MKAKPSGIKCLKCSGYWWRCNSEYEGGCADKDKLEKFEPIFIDKSGLPGNLTREMIIKANKSRRFA